MNPNLRRWAERGGIAFGVFALCFAAYAIVTEPGVWRRFWYQLIERPGGPMTFRFLLQPVMAFVAAWHDGAKDAATGRSPYFWTVLTDPRKRGPRLREGLEATGRILLLGLVMDLIYQVIVFGHFFPMEAIVMALLLAFLPYLLLRGPISRAVTWWHARRTDPPRSPR